MRNSFAKEVVDMASSDPRIVLLSGDIGNRLFDDLRANNSNQFVNCGIAEANMMSVAAGMALSGLRPIVYTITPFTTTRCFEQIRVDVAYHNAPVMIVGTGSGLSYAELGATHHSLEDMAIMRSLPGMQILAPCDPYELRLCMRAALDSNMPTYIRIGKKGEANFYPQGAKYKIGKSQVIKSGKDVLLLSVGTIISEVTGAAQDLELNGISCEIVNVGTVKPFDQEYISVALNKFKLIAVVEEHGVIGGMGSAVSEYLSEKERHPILMRFGTPDIFLHEIGSQNYARDIFGLTAHKIAKKIKDAIIK